MIKIIIIIAALLAGLILGPEISTNKGYILVSVDGYTTYEMTIINAVLIALVFYFLLLFAEWFLRKLLSMSAVTRGWFGQRKTTKARKNSMLGMLALLEGNNKQAQKLLEKSAARSDSPALTYIAAAKAAHYQGKYKLRDEHFQQAYDSQKDGQLAVGLAWAELQLEANEYENAQRTLQKLDKKFPKNRRISELYLSLYPALQQWQNYIDLLNSKRNVLPVNETELEAMLLDAYQHLFREMAEQGGEVLETFWNKKSPRWMRKELDYQEALLNAQIKAGNYKFAETFLLDKLNKQFSLPLLAYINELQLSDYYPLIVLLEKQLEKQPEPGLIHQALARLHLKENKTAAALLHLQESVKSKPNVDDLALLADLLLKYDRVAEANEYYRQGLLLATSAK
ncbi:MAG: heme biosynthesis protein HemY [Psychromonas sp.]|nr:heme biosynthesis protein HemY [Psychromonas sp.]